MFELQHQYRMKHCLYMLFLLNKQCDKITEVSAKQWTNKYFFI